MYSIQWKCEGNRMKQWRRWTALVLALVLLFGLTANAAETTIEIPQGWAHDALAFCVEKGILAGDAKGDLMPTAKAQRAQLAAMLVRLFRAEPEADLSQYTDVEESDWFYKELSQAVAMGLFEGSNGKLNPRKAITREQAFTVLARAFGVASDNADLFLDFSDSYLVSSWARPMIAGLIEADYVHGNANGTLNPQGEITRQELAQVLYNAIDCITEDAQELHGKSCLYYGSLDDLQGKTIPGDLILSCDVPEEVILDGFRVEGRLVLQLHGAKTVTVGAVADNVTVAMPAEVSFTEEMPKVVCTRDGAALQGTITQAVLSADCKLRGSFGTVILCDGKAVVEKEAIVETVLVPALCQGNVFRVNGQVSKLHCHGKKLTVTGTGKVNVAFLYASGFTAECKVGSRENRIDAGLDGATLSTGQTPKAYFEANEVTVSATLHGVDTSRLYGVEGGVRKGRVSFFYQGKCVVAQENVVLTDGAEFQCTLKAQVLFGREETQKVQMVVQYGLDTLTAQLPIQSIGRFTPDREAKTIQTAYVTATIRYTTTLYTTSSLSTYKSTLTAGTVVYYLKSLEDNGGACWIETKDGVRGWAIDSAVKISWQTYHSDTVSYSQEAKEYFVNTLHTYNSPSQYLIWVNLYTTTVNIFEGSKGNWKLIKSCECVVGAPGTPTRPGVYSIYAHNAFWSFDSNGVLDVSRCYNCSLFDGGIAFHTRLKYTGSNTYVNSALSAELSHGCVRCPDDIAQFIYYQVPIGTTVVVY